FQPELRRALEQLGRGNLFTRSTKSEEEILEQMIDDIVESCNYMAKRRMGALITIERETGIGEYAETGIPINGKLSHQLLTNIFTPNTPLHDGAVIIKRDQIVAAACYLPLSENPFIAKDLGTRHRAAMGISEVTDAVTIVVSEETGQISGTKNGELRRELSSEELRDYLYTNLASLMKSPDKSLRSGGEKRMTKNWFNSKWFVRAISLAFAVLLYIFVNIEAGNSQNEASIFFPNENDEVQTVEEV